MYRGVNSAKDNDRFNAWATELCAEVTSDDLKEYPALQKVFRHLMGRVRPAKTVERHLNYSKSVKLATEAEANEAELRAIRDSCGSVQRSSNQSSSLEVLLQQLKHQQALFTLVTRSAMYQEVVNSRSGSSASAPTPRELADKLSTLMTTLTKYCANVDNVESLLKSEAAFNHHYYKHVHPQLPKEGKEGASLTQLAKQIEAKMRTIATTFEQVLAKVTVTAAIDVDEEVESAGGTSVEKIESSPSPSPPPPPPKVDIPALQGLLNQWTSLYSDADQQ